MKPCVFIHTNHKQYIGALVSQYSFKRNSPNADKFDVNIIHSNDHPFLRAKEGQSFLRAGGMRVWHMEDLQSFTPLRFLAPELMGYEGRAVVVDPDVFAVGDVYELLTRDMAGKAIMCRTRTGSKGEGGGLATSVMLLDCAKLTHWRGEEQFNELFAGKRDYMDWILLHDEPKDSIGLFEDEWNDFDRLAENTKLLHNTKRQTQPWKSGLPIDFTWADKKVEPLEAGDLAAPDQALEDLVRDDLQGASGQQPGALLLRPAARMPGQGRGHRGSCCARRCATTTSATTPWSWSSAPRRSRRKELPSCRPRPTRLVARGSGRYRPCLAG